MRALALGISKNKHLDRRAVPHMGICRFQKAVNRSRRSKSGRWCAPLPARRRLNPIVAPARPRRSCRRFAMMAASSTMSPWTSLSITVTAILDVDLVNVSFRGNGTLTQREQAMWNRIPHNASEGHGWKYVSCGRLTAASEPVIKSQSLEPAHEWIAEGTAGGWSETER